MDLINIIAELTIRGSRAVALLKTLSARDEKVIRLRFGIGCQRGHTLEDIGWKLNLTRQRICQIEARALRRLGSLCTHPICLSPRRTTCTNLLSARSRSKFPVLLFWAVGEGEANKGDSNSGLAGESGFPA